MGVVRAAHGRCIADRENYPGDTQTVGMTISIARMRIIAFSRWVMTIMSRRLTIVITSQSNPGICSRCHLSYHARPAIVNIYVSDLRLGLSLFTAVCQTINSWLYLFFGGYATKNKYNHESIHLRDTYKEAKYTTYFAMLPSSSIAA